MGMAVFLEGAKLSAHLKALSGGGYKEVGDLARPRTATSWSWA